MRRLPIGPEEAFVLSRVDGKTNELELVHATGLAAATVQRCLGRLAAIGAIAFDVAQEEARRPQPSLPPRNAIGTRREHPATEQAQYGSTSTSTAALYDPAELDEPVDLDLARKRRILDLFYRLDALSHYEVLEVPEGADKKAVKNAYFEVVSIFHPDKYFGKNLGSFKTKLDRVFARLTEAHDVLTRKATRDEYDAYLRTQQKNRSLERLLSDERHRLTELERVRREIEDEARLAERSSQTSLRGVTPPVAAVFEPLPPMDPEARRRALARKLGRSTLSPRDGMPEPAAASQPSKEYVAHDLKRRYEERLLSARTTQIRHYLSQAEQALGEKNNVAAANALRIAASLAPDDTSIAERLSDVQSQADAELSKSYLEQAEYEEKSGRALDAARSYELAARGTPSAHVFEKVATCLVAGGGDLRKAADFAKRAVALLPKDVKVRVLLVRIYMAAGMKQSAASEVERVSALAPDDEEVQTLLKRLRRGES
jgi:curved DNA-binding protein CbpA